MSQDERVERAIEVSVPVSHQGFDPLGPVVQTSQVPSGRTLRFIDEGDPEWTPLVWFGGGGTSVRAFGLLEFARSFREELGVRVVSVERNGLGGTRFDATQGLREYAADVWALLDQRGVADPSIMAISGGGPYAAHVIASRPQAIRSMHIACALSEVLPGVPTPGLDIEVIANDPVSWWTYSSDSTVQQIPGFVDCTVAEATSGMFTQGRHSEPQGLRQARSFYLTEPMPDLSAATAPAFLYWGSEDPLVTTAHLRRWARDLPHAVIREYAGESHDVQYRHWDQVLCDVVHLGARVVVADDHRTLLTPAEDVPALLAAGWSLGLRAWRHNA